jgi:hypothetical protein
MKKENAVIFGVTGVVVAAVLIGGGIYMKTERDRNLNADTASTAADSNRAEEVQKAVFLAEDSGLWYLGDLEHGNIYVTHTPSDTLYDENGNAIDPSEIKKGDFLQVEGDGIMLNSYPGQYPGISRIMRISGGTEADAEKFDEELSRILPGGNGRTAMLQGYEEMAVKLGDTGAPAKAASLMLRLLERGVGRRATSDSCR